MKDCMNLDGTTTEEHMKMAITLQGCMIMEEHLTMDRTTVEDRTLITVQTKMGTLLLTTTAMPTMNHPMTPHMTTTHHPSE